MKIIPIGFGLFLSLCIQSNVFSNCDLTRFHWQCDLAIHPKATAYADVLVYCGTSFGFISKRQAELLERYQRVNVNMALKINGEYIDSPCIAAYH